MKENYLSSLLHWFVFALIFRPRLFTYETGSFPVSQRRCPPPLQSHIRAALGPESLLNDWPFAPLPGAVYSSGSFVVIYIVYIMKISQLLISDFIGVDDSSSYSYSKRSWPFWQSSGIFQDAFPQTSSTRWTPAPGATTGSFWLPKEQRFKEASRPI